MVKYQRRQHVSHPPAPSLSRTDLLDDAVELHEVPLSDRLGEREVWLEGHHETLLVEHGALRYLTEQELLKRKTN